MIQGHFLTFHGEENAEFRIIVNGKDDKPLIIPPKMRGFNKAGAAPPPWEFLRKYCREIPLPKEGEREKAQWRMRGTLNKGKGKGEIRGKGKGPLLDHQSRPGNPNDEKEDEHANIKNQEQEENIAQQRGKGSGKRSHIRNVSGKGRRKNQYVKKKTKKN